MNKFLLGTTALVGAVLMAAPALSAERIQLQLRGYHVGGISLTNASGTGFRVPLIGIPFFTTLTEFNEINFGSDSEVHFVGSTTLDNGLEVSFHAELELEDDSDVDNDADQIDEVYIQFQGGFGRLQFGQNDGAQYQLHIAAPNTFVGHGVNQPDVRLDPFAPLIGASLVNTYSGLSGDHIKITYLTPSMNGLQFGFSYTPNPCKNDTGYAGCVSDEYDRNHWEVGAAWETQFDNLKIGISGGYGRGEESGGPFFPGAPTEWTLGGHIGFGGFTFGGSYRDFTSDDTHEESHWDIGATYESGPWGLTAQYAEFERDIAGPFPIPHTSSDDEDNWLVGITYMYGPGMQLGIGAQGRENFREFASPFGSGWDKFDGTSIFLENAITF